MNLGKNLFNARKKSGFSQEEIAEKLGVTRQTISKWETDESVPDIVQTKKLAVLYKLSLDELVKFDIELSEIEKYIENSNEEINNKIDWTNVWSKKYPILKKYKKEVDIEEYIIKLNEMLFKLKKDYKYNDLDAFLVLKDILSIIWKDR